MGKDPTTANKVTGTIEINNQVVAFDFPSHQRIEQSLQQFLNRTKNSPNDPKEWTLLNGSTKVNKAQTWLEAGIADGVALKLRLARDGIGA